MFNKDEEARKAMAEAGILNMVNLIAGNHNCKVIDIDFDNHVINLSGDKKSEHDCAVAIGDYIESASGELF